MSIREPSLIGNNSTSQGFLYLSGATCESDHISSKFFAEMKVFASKLLVDKGHFCLHYHDHFQF